MLALLLLTAAPQSPTPPDTVRRVIEAQLRAPPRQESGLSTEEAAVIRQRYLESIGQRPPQPSSQDRTDSQ